MLLNTGPASPVRRRDLACVQFLQSFKGRQDACPTRADACSSERLVVKSALVIVHYCCDGLSAGRDCSNFSISVATFWCSTAELSLSTFDIIVTT